MKIGVFGGTFDPCTVAHYEIVDKVLKERLVDKVVVIPTIVDYYRKDKERMFTNEQRLEILRAWFKDRKNVIIDDYEYKFAAAVEGAVNYDVTPKNYLNRISERRYWHTLHDIMNRYAEASDFLTIVGGDSWNNLTSWYNFRELGTMTKFIVVSRAKQPVNFYINYPEYHYQPHKVLDIGEEQSMMSATSIRNKLRSKCHADAIDMLIMYLKEIEEILVKKKAEAMDNLDKSEELLANTPIFDVIRGPETEPGFRPVKVKSPEWVSVIAETCGRFIMVNQFRHGLGREFEEFPCGMVEDNELPVFAAMRELKEETGIQLDDYNDLKYLGRFAANPAFMTNYMHYYYVNLDKVAYKSVKMSLDEHEHLVAWQVHKKAAYDIFMKSDGSSLMAGAWLKLKEEGIV